MSVESVFDPAIPGLQPRLAVLKALADACRLQVVNALLERPHCAEELAERLRRAPSTISFHLRKLDEAGLLSKTRTQYYLVYALRPELLRMTVGELVGSPAPADAAERRRLERYRQKVLRTFFRDGALVQMPKQWRKRRVVLDEIGAKFEPGRSYPEHEVNERIATVWADYCTVRRLLIDEGYMTRDGQSYHVLPPRDEKARVMETRKELKRKYRETPKQAGIFQVKNTVTGKVLLGSSTNLHGPLNKHRFGLSIGSHQNRELQQDWTQYGADAFVFEILEVVEQKDTPEFSLDDELTLLEQIWLERLNPIAPRGYNRDGRIRDA